MTLLEKLKQAACQRLPVQLAGVQLRLRLLTEEDYAKAGMAAHLAFTEVEMTPTSADLYERRLANELLLLALLDAEEDKPVFSSVSELAQTLTREQKAFLLEEYLAFERNFNPARMREEDLAALLEEVKKTPQTTRLNDLSFATLKKLLRYLASQPSH
ncbi:hypothetical protein [Aquitalea aquatica]|uniref:Uncharacterized protein n=1 Tax=Aquitalea aquatica TaxID=3044273 RepID=A0A838YET5_9NEIS|nr:hypothetical protein [Aquitalea magnusonii]MBA4709575.1 hypothetical protein [Aquitalea magnusonii]